MKKPSNRELNIINLKALSLKNLILIDKLVQLLNIFFRVHAKGTNFGHMKASWYVFSG